MLVSFIPKRVVFVLEIVNLVSLLPGLFLESLKSFLHLLVVQLILIIGVFTRCVVGVFVVDLSNFCENLLNHEVSFYCIPLYYWSLYRVQLILDFLLDWTFPLSFLQIWQYHLYFPFFLL